MSNSYRKRPVYKWHGKNAKKIASRAFRHFKGDIPIKMKRFYRRVYSSWDVCDNWYCDFQNEERRKQYRLIVRELYQNAYDEHLTEEEAIELLEQLDDLRFCFFYRNK